MATIDAYLSQRREEKTLRVLRPAAQRRGGRIERDGQWLLDLASNDYLDLAGHPYVKQTATEATQRYGAGSGASRLLSGDLSLFHDLETRTAALKGKPAARVFNSGYQANVGIVSALCGRRDAVFCDRLAHASLLDGVALAGARLYRFYHNDPEHLSSLLSKTEGDFERRLVVTESVFSMDGDLAPLVELAAVSKRYGATFMVDEAHATGLFGPDGSGVVAEQGVTDDVDLIMGTYSKALGGFGGFVACTAATKQYLTNTARSFVYSTALPPGVVAGNMAALELLEREPERRLAVLSQAAWLRSELRQRGLEVGGDSPIVPWYVGEAERAVTFSEALQTCGFWAPAIRPPTVPPGRSRLRLSLSYAHRRADLLALLAAIDEVKDV